VVLSACGSEHVGPSAGTTTTRTTTATESPATHAAVDAASLLAAFGPPPGATRTGPLAVSVLAGAPAAPASPELVTRTQWYRVPGRWQAVYGWFLAHPPTGLTRAGDGMASQRCTGAAGSCVTTRYVWYSRPPVPGVLTQRSLEISVAGDGAGLAAVRVDAVDVWVPARPASERIPASAKVVTITPVRGIGPVTGARPVTITDPATVARIAAVIDSLPVFPPGSYNCGMDQGRGMRLTFRAAAGGPMLAVIQGDYGGCGTVSVTINGRPMPALGAALTMQQQVLAIAGVQWPGFPAK
jgi:hypothetical protein